MKRFWKITLWTLFVAGVGTVLGFAKSEHRQIPCNLPVVNINNNTGHDFVQEEDVLRRLNNIGYAFTGEELCDVDLFRIEQEVRKIPGVSFVDAFTYVNGSLQIDVQQRRPILRIINRNGTSFYLDEKGEVMPLSDKYHARIPVVNGYINESITFGMEAVNESDSLANEVFLDELYEMAKYLDHEEFWQQQIVQLHVNRDKEYELIPRIGNQRILFGDNNNLEGKFKKLKLFYTEGIETNQLNQYDTLIVKYKGQIVCSKIN